MIHSRYVLGATSMLVGALLVIGCGVSPPTDATVPAPGNSAVATRSAQPTSPSQLRATPTAPFVPQPTLAAVATTAPTTTPLSIESFTALSVKKQPVKSAIWSPTGKILAVQFEEVPDLNLPAGSYISEPIHLWNAKGEPLTAPTDPAMTGSMLWSPDGTSLAIKSSGGPVYLWNVTDQGATIQGSVEEGNTDSKFPEIAWSPDSKVLLVLYPFPNTAPRIVLVNTQGKQIATLPWDGRTIVRWSPASPMLAAGFQDGSFRVWNAAGKEIGRSDADENGFTDLRWSPDGKMLAKPNPEDVRIWAISNTVKEIGKVNIQPNAVSWAPNSSALGIIGVGSNRPKAILWAVAGKNTVDLGTGSACDNSQLSAKCLESFDWSPDSTALVIGASKLLFYSAAGQQTGQQTVVGGRIASIDGHHSRAYSWSPDGKTLTVLTTYVGNTGLYETVGSLFDRGGKLISNLPPQGGFTGVISWSPNRKFRAMSLADGTVHIWDADGLALAVLTSNIQHIAVVAWSSDSQTLAGWEVGNVIHDHLQIWSLPETLGSH